MIAGGKGYERLEWAAATELLASVGHELRNPIQSVTVGLALLEPDVPDTHRDTVSSIRRQLALTRRLLDDLLDVSALVEGRLTLETSPVDLVALVRQTARDLAWRFDEKGVAFFFEARTPLTATVDAQRVTQVLQNLLSNAIRHTPAGGGVRVRVFQEQERAVIEVEDDGEGIEPEEVERLFQPFYRGARTQPKSEASLGLGLAIVAGIAEAHGGRVEAQSEGPGRGATFRVWLPV